MQSIVRGILLVMIAIISQTAFAQVTPQDQRRALDTLNRLEQQQGNTVRKFEREHERRLRERKPTSIDAPAPEAHDIPEGKCFDVTSITLEGAEHLSEKRKQAITSPYLNQCLDLATIDHIMRDITNYYVDKGHVTTRVTLPQQNIKDGSLELLVIEGRIENIQLNENNTWHDHMTAETAFPFMEDKVLNLRDVEQGLDQINRMASSNATVDMLPGNKNGYTILNVINQPEKRTRIMAGIDNSGQESTGELKAFASVEHDNLFGLGDIWGVNYNKSAETSGGTKDSEILSSHMSIPYGYWTLFGNASYSEYETTIVGTNQSFTSSGETRAASAKLDRVLHRNQDNKTSANLGLTLKDTRNFVEGTELETGSQNLTIVRLGVDHTHVITNTMVYAGIGYEKGLDILGGKEDNALTSIDPVAEFDKFTLDASVYRPFTVKNIPFAYQMITFGQYSPDVLYSSESITIGDRYTVRGFHKDSLAGDTGGYIRNELIYSIPPLVEHATAQKLIGNMQSYIGLDIGTVDSNAAGSGTLSGGVLGIRNHSEWLTFDFAAAKAISSPNVIQEKSLEVYFSVGTRFSF